MAGKLNRFQTVGFTSWKGLTKDNHLGSIFQKKPQLATNIMIQLLAYKYGKTLETSLAKYPVREFETDDEYTWQVIGSSRRNIPLIEARTEDGTVVTADSMVGAGMTPFYLVFGEDWFADGEIITGEHNEIYPIRVLGSARMEGTNAVYKCEVWGSVPGGIPAEEFETGKKFSVETAYVERELSRGVGDRLSYVTLQLIAA